MFGWLKGKKRSDIHSDPELKRIFGKIKLLFESEAFQNSLLPEALKGPIVRGLNCDKIPGGKGEFGREPTNPIPVNGPLGQILYLSQLRTVSNSPIMFHRVTSTPVGHIEVDMYEVLSIDQTVREYLYLSYYHPRRSRLCPTGYWIERKIDFGNPIYGVNFLVLNFPHHLDQRIREWQMLTLKFPFSVNEVRKYLYGGTVPTLVDSHSIVWNGRKRDGSDSSGLCVHCWAVKQYFVMACEHCGHRPKTEDEAIYSLALSAMYYDPITLKKMSEFIGSGQKAISLSLEQMDALRLAARTMLEKVNSYYETGR